MKDSNNKVILSLADVCVDTITDICCIDSQHVVIVKGKPKNESLYLYCLSENESLVFCYVCNNFAVQ